MPGAIRSFMGHFAPHVALALCMWIIVTMTPSLFIVGVVSVVRLPTALEGIIVAAATVTVSFSYLWLRYSHDRRQCSACDRKSRRDRLRSDPVGLLSRHFHWCRRAPGIWISLIVLFVFACIAMVSYVGTLLIYAGMALWLASTIAHQGRIRSCPKHDDTIMYDPRQPQWFSEKHMLAALHQRARGYNALKVECLRDWCRKDLPPASILALSPEEAMIWVLAHSDEHAAAYGRLPVVSVRVTVDPHLQPGKVAASR